MEGISILFSEGKGCLPIVLDQSFYNSKRSPKSPRSSCNASIILCQKRSYAQQTRHNYDDSQDVISSMFDLRATLSIMNLYIAVNFEVSPKILLEPFLVSTTVGESVLAKWVYMDCHSQIFRKSPQFFQQSQTFLILVLFFVWIRYTLVSPQLTIGVESLNPSFQ